MSEQRAEGFWWVRLCGLWDVARIAREGAYFGTYGPLALSVDEWGPYLGKEPGGQSPQMVLTTDGFYVHVEDLRPPQSDDERTDAVIRKAVERAGRLAVEDDENKALRQAAREYAEAWSDYKNERRKTAAVIALEAAAEAFVMRVKGNSP